MNALGAKSIVKAAGGITTALADNDIRAGQWVDVVYDGTNMQMQSGLGNASAGGGSGYAEIQDNATPVTARTKVNFKPATGFTWTIDDNVDKTDITGVPDTAVLQTLAAGQSWASTTCTDSGRPGVAL